MAATKRVNKAKKAENETKGGAGARTRITRAA